MSFFLFFEFWGFQAFYVVAQVYDRWASEDQKQLKTDRQASVLMVSFVLYGRARIPGKRNLGQPLIPRSR